MSASFTPTVGQEEFYASVVAAVHALGTMCPTAQDRIVEMAIALVPADVVAMRMRPTENGRFRLRAVVDQAVVRRHVGLCALRAGAVLKA